jgi:hypothetical protein
MNRRNLLKASIAASAAFVATSRAGGHTVGQAAKPSLPTDSVTSWRRP